LGLGGHEVSLASTKDLDSFSQLSFLRLSTGVISGSRMLYYIFNAQHRKRHVDMVEGTLPRFSIRPSDQSLRD